MSISEDNSKMSRSKPIDFDKFKFRRAEGGSSNENFPVPLCEWWGLGDDLVSRIVRLAFWNQVDKLTTMSRFSQMMHRVCVRVLTKILNLNQAQCEVFIDALNGENVFLTGGAGVGKTHVLKAIVKHLAIRTKHCHCTASTGCAAALLDCRTVHSTLGLMRGNLSPQLLVKVLNRVNGKDEPHPAKLLIERLRILIIDEISMLDGLTLDTASIVVDAIKKRGRRKVVHPLLGSELPEDDYSGPQPIHYTPRPLPFGGIQIIVAGDFMQLPPVEQDKRGWAFQARCWHELNFKNHVLTTIVRQQDDEAFMNILARARRGEST